ncbi:Uncharacterised protein [Vibrio cholerae]|nr:Uncharacterised protein [Vibrio cholerae]CSC84000.1 Uncharacterised protein [Vibrio cholerae]
MTHLDDVSRTLCDEKVFAIYSTEKDNFVHKLLHTLRRECPSTTLCASSLRQPC